MPKLMTRINSGIANTLRGAGVLADKIQPGKALRSMANRVDALDPGAYSRRLEELKNLEAAIVNRATVVKEPTHHVTSPTFDSAHSEEVGDCSSSDSYVP